MNHTHNDQNNVYATWGVSLASDPSRKAGLRVNNDCLTVGLYDKNGAAIISGTTSAITIPGTITISGNAVWGVAGSAFTVTRPTATAAGNATSITGQAGAAGGNAGGALNLTGGSGTTSSAGGNVVINGGISASGNAGSVTIGSASQSVAIGQAAKATTVLGTLGITGVTTVSNATATPAGGSAAAVLLFGTTAGFGIYYGSSTPTVSAGQGSIYLRSDGSSTSTRLYVNTNGTTGWTNLTSAT